MQGLANGIVGGINNHQLTLLALGAGIAQGGVGRGLALATSAAQAERNLQAQQVNHAHVINALTGVGDPGCRVPAVALINLLRLNDVAADLVLVWMRQTSPSDPARLLDGLAVYVPSLGHYVDPTTTDWHKNATFDRFVRAHAGRAHIIGPAPNADPVSDPCASTCMVMHDRVGDSPSILFDSVPVKTETIHVPKRP